MEVETDIVLECRPRSPLKDRPGRPLSRWPETSRTRAHGPGPGARAEPPIPNTLPLELDWNWVMTSPIPTLRHCPKSCRRAWGETLHKTLKAITTDQDNEAKWILLFALAKLLLRLPPRNNKRSRNNAFRAGEWLSSLLTRARRGDWENLFREAESSARPIKTTQAPKNTVHEVTPLARDIRRKTLQLAQEGQFAKAVKNLTSAGLRNLDEETKEELKNKHPQEPPQPRTLGNA